MKSDIREQKSEQFIIRKNDTCLEESLGAMTMATASGNII
jgi:hypothetical protein